MKQDRGVVYGRKAKRWDAQFPHVPTVRASREYLLLDLQVTEKKIKQLVPSIFAQNMRNNYRSFTTFSNVTQYGFELSKLVTGTCASFCSYSIQTPGPASWHHLLMVFSQALMSTVTGIRQSMTNTSSGGTTLDCTPPCSWEIARNLFKLPLKIMRLPLARLQGEALNNKHY